MIGCSVSNLLRSGLRLSWQVWPLLLAWWAWHFADDQWRIYLLTLSGSQPGEYQPFSYQIALKAWPTIALMGPAAVMALSIQLHRWKTGSRLMAVLGIVALAVCALLTGWPDYQRLWPYVGTPNLTVVDFVHAFDSNRLTAIVIGLVGSYIGHCFIPRPPAQRSTHGSAHFGEVAAARHLAPAAPADAFVLGYLHGVSHKHDARFRQDGHVLTCAPSGAGKGIGAVIPNLLTYPGSAFVLDLKGELYAVTARARRELGQQVILVDPFGITGANSQALNWLDTLDPDSPDVVSRAAGLADMLIAVEGTETDSHWTDTARELLRGLLVYVATLPADRRTMAELRRIVTASADDLAAALDDMTADPEAGQRIPARAAAAHLNRPERERGSVLSTVVRHTAWLDDPRLCAALARSEFNLADLKRQPMTVYLAIPPDRLRACLGFVRGFIGLALDGITAAPGKPAHRVAFFLDEFGQLGRMDRLADSVTLLRGYGAQLWLFVQDLSQLKAVYPRWQSFLANTSQQFFGTADFDTARYLSGALGQQTIRYETQNVSQSSGTWGKPGSSSSGSGEHLQGRSLLTPDEVMRLGPTRPIVLISGEPPYLLDRVSYLTDPAYAGLFDANPQHLPHAAE